MASNLNKKDINNCSRGFSLIEMIVAFGIFFAIAGTATVLFVEAVKSQRRTLAYQQVLDNISYVMEYMGRSLRMAKKDVVGACVTSAGSDWANYEIITTPYYGIRFLAYESSTGEYKCKQFYLEGNVLKQQKSSDEQAANFGAAVQLTSSRLIVLGFKVGSWGWEQIDNLQPKVTLSIEAKEQTEGQPVIRIQTSVSQRNLDVIN